MSIVHFPTLQERSPHITGMARCLACKHEWIAVAPVGVYELQCPECTGWKGVFKNPVGSSDRPTFECNCGCHLFYITHPFEVNCWSCGATIDAADL